MVLDEIPEVQLWINPHTELQKAIPEPFYAKFIIEQTRHGKEVKYHLLGMAGERTGYELEDFFFKNHRTRGQSTQMARIGGGRMSIDKGEISIQPLREMQEGYRKEILAPLIERWAQRRTPPFTIIYK